MEFTINKTAFSDALSLLSSIVPERAARAIMQNLMLSGQPDNTIVLSATDLEIGVKMTLEVKDMQDPSQILLPAGRLNALVKGSFSDELHIAINDLKAEIKTRQGRFQISGSDTLDYPTIPDFKTDGAFFIHGYEFAEAVQKTIFATAKGDTRYALNGIFVNVTEHTADFVASDTHRLALVRKKIRNPDNSACDGIIPVKGMSILSRLAANADIVEMNISQNELLARTPNATLVVRRVEGMFPRYSDVIPAKSDNSLTANRDELQRALQSIGLMTSDETKSILMTCAANVLSLSAQSENGEGNINLDAELVGDNMDIKFNYVFLLDALKHIDDEKVTIQFKDKENPARIDSGDFMYVIMPINR